MTTPADIPTEIPQGTPDQTQVPPGGGQAAGAAPAAPEPDDLTIGEGAPIKPEAPAAAAPGSEAVSYEPSGNPALDVALEFIGGLGFGPDSAAMKAAEQGDFAVLEAQLAMLGDKAKGYERFVAIGKQAYAAGKAEAEARRAADVAKIHEAAGGKEEWLKIQAWAGQSATAEEKAEVNAALAQGGMVARATVAYLKERFAAATAAADAVPPSARVARPGTASGQPASSVLSPREYADEVEKLARRLGDNLTSSPEYASLRARRAAYRG